MIGNAVPDVDEAPDAPALKDEETESLLLETEDAK
ncbi:hypothetical protein AHiyo4_07400 [Arthrobacter sp. Hiyo4]|nr:hypothetical protein AHiyo4_07400 [Arthrobacter sp. Hiyo4]